MIPIDLQVSTMGSTGEVMISKGLTYDHIRGLAVTSFSFGFFEVTHIETGLKIAGGFERMANAVLAMFEIEYMTRQAGEGFDSIHSKEEAQFFLKRIGDKDVKISLDPSCSEAPFKQLLALVRHSASEFPYEEEINNPAYLASEIDKAIEKMIN